jgi:hypothetical protein
VRRSRDDQHSSGIGEERGLHWRAGMWIVIGVLFVIGWLMLKLVWGVASLAVHALLVAAVVALAVHFMRGRFSKYDSPAGT